VCRVSHEPIVLPRSSAHCRTLDEALAFFDQSLNDQARLYRTNILLAVESGELRPDSGEAAIALADEEYELTRVDTRRRLAMLFESLRRAS